MLSLFHIPLSQNKQNRVNFPFARLFTNWMVYLGLLLGSASLNATAYAGVTGFKPQARKSVIYKTTFNEVSDMTSPRLDWRSPTTEMTFTIPDSAWVENLELLISGSPVGRIDPGTPVLIKFNNADPIPIYPGSHNFDARIKLDRGHIRARNNKLTFSFKKPDSNECPTEHSGGWDLDFDKSTIVIKARTRMRAIQIRDLKTQISTATLAPKKVAIIAKGSNALKLKAMAAQGLGLNMKTVPVIKSDRRGADMELILATRSQIKPLLRDDFAIRDKGPRMVISEGYPLQVAITGDSEDEVMELAKAFATYDLPTVRGRKASLGDFYFRSPFSMLRLKVDGKVNLAQIGNLKFDDRWGANPQTVTFDVENPAISHGKTVMRFHAASSVDPKSFVEISLNGKILGRTQLDARRKSVTFDIPRGLLTGLNNKLVISPDLTPQSVSGDCGIAKVIPGFSLGTGSFLQIKTDRHAALTDLSRFAASGFPFSKKKATSTTVIFSQNSEADLNAGLRVLAQLAKASGEGWTDAEFTQHSSDIPSDQNILMIGAALTRGHAFYTHAPRSLRAAISGPGYKPSKTIRSASLKSSDAVHLLSIRENGPAQIKGGVAAVYSDEVSNRYIGVISNMPGQSFTRTVDHLLNDNHWNALEGSVAKWDKRDVLMAQTALPEKYYRNTEPKSPLERIIPTPEKLQVSLPDFSGDFQDGWIRMKLALNRTSDRAHNFWRGRRADRLYKEDLTLVEHNPLPKAKPKTARETLQTAPLNLRGAQTDRPVFIAAKDNRRIGEADISGRPPIYVPPKLRQTSQPATPAIGNKPANTQLENIQLNLSDGIGSLKRKTTNLFRSYGMKPNGELNMTFWFLIIIGLLMFLSLASPKSRT